MGLNKFNQWGNTGSGSSLLYRMKPTPLVSQLYGQGEATYPYTPVVRAGAYDKSFDVGSTTSELYTTSSVGSETLVATITYSAYLADSKGVAYHMNSSDGCLYVLLRASNTLRLVKINDTNGVVTTIGSSFTPTTPASWPTADIGMTLMEVDSISGHITLKYNGFSHSINKTTGAIVSQDVVVTVGSFLAKRVLYVTQDGTVGLGDQTVSSLVGEYYFPNTVHTAHGIISGYSLPQAATGYMRAGGVANAAQLRMRDYCLVDNDKVLCAMFDGPNAGGWKLYQRTEFDKWIKSIAELGAGVI